MAAILGFHQGTEPGDQVGGAAKCQRSAVLRLKLAQDVDQDQQQGRVDRWLLAR